MELSILVARIIAVIYIAAGIGVLIGQIDFNKLAAEFSESTALTYSAGSFSIIIGMILIHHHNLWVSDWRILITIISWMFFIGGIVVVVSPKSLQFFSKYYKHSPVWGIFMICFGLLFGYLGFVN